MWSLSTWFDSNEQDRLYAQGGNWCAVNGRFGRHAISGIPDGIQKRAAAGQLYRAHWQRPAAGRCSYFVGWFVMNRLAKFLLPIKSFVYVYLAWAF